MEEEDWLDGSTYRLGMGRYLNLQIFQHQHTWISGFNCNDMIFAGAHFAICHMMHDTFDCCADDMKLL